MRKSVNGRRKITCPLGVVTIPVSTSFEKCLLLNDDALEIFIGLTDVLSFLGVLTLLGVVSSIFHEYVFFDRIREGIFG